MKSLGRTGQSWRNESQCFFVGFFREVPGNVFKRVGLNDLAGLASRRNLPAPKQPKGSSFLSMGYYR
jgi:hypothetical protein